MTDFEIDTACLVLGYAGIPVLCWWLLWRSDRRRKK
jgi:hypothetical protein